MTGRLYYQNSFLYNFTAAVESVLELADGRRALLLDNTAFYPTSCGQPFDTGWVEFVSAESERPVGLPKLRVSEVVEDESSGEILHIVEQLPEPLPLPLPPSTRVRGFIDVERRQDHMQQHSGQHVLSAAFRKLFAAPTLSFHLGEELCTIDLDLESLSSAQMEQAERLANQFVWEDRQVLMHEVTRSQAQQLSVSKLPEASRESSYPETMRLIEIRGVDLCACGGTHVKNTGQIGNIQLRKAERVGQGMRVEFVCGARALRLARRDFEALTGAAARVQAVPTQ